MTTILAALSALILAGAWLLGEMAYRVRSKRINEQPDDSALRHLATMREIAERCARAQAEWQERHARDADRGEEWME